MYGRGGCGLVLTIILTVLHSSGCDMSRSIENPTNGDFGMFKQFFSAVSAFALVSTLALATAFALEPAPASADDWFSGEVHGDYNAWSLGGSGGVNGGSGAIAERYSWAGSSSENSASMNFVASTEPDVSGSFTADSSASAGAGNYIKTQGSGASNTYSLSGSGVMGGFDGSASGSFESD